MTPRPQPRAGAAPDPPTAFSIDIEPQREAVRVAPKGELDLSTIEQLRLALRELTDVGFAKIVIDLGGVEFLDSTGLHTLLTTHAQAQRDGWELSIIPGSRAVQRLFEITCMNEQLPFVKVNGITH